MTKVLGLKLYWEKFENNEEKKIVNSCLLNVKQIDYS